MMSALLALTMVVSLTGCGGGDDSGTVGDQQPPVPPTPPSITVTSDYYFLEEVANPHEPTVVELSAILAGMPATKHRAASSKPILRDVELTDSDRGVCTLSGHDQNSLTVSTVGYGICTFDLTITKEGKEQTSELLLSLTRSQDVTLPALSYVLTPNAVERVDLTSDTTIDGLLNSGYELSPEYTLMGDVKVDIAGNTVEITSSENLGLNRVFYHLVKGGEDADHKTGIIDVTVTRDANDAPQILIPDFARTVASNQVVDIDLRKDGIVTDRPQDLPKLQIIHVFAPAGGALALGTSGAPINSYAPTNVAFHFSSELPGQYPIVYTVSDHNGGYASGTVIINVGKLTSPDTPLANNRGQMVENVQLKDEYDKWLLIQRPFLYAEAHLEMPELFPEIPDETNSTTLDDETWLYVDQETAVQFCGHRNRKPITRSGFKALLEYTNKLPVKLRVAATNMTNKLGWPQGVYDNNGTPGGPERNYVVQDTAAEGNGQYAAATTGEFSAGQSQGLVLCVSSPERVMAAIPESLTFNAPDQVQEITIGNAPISGLSCSVEPAHSVRINECSGDRIRLTGVERGDAVLTVKSLAGENITGSEPSKTVHIYNTFTGSGVGPTVSNVVIERCASGNDCTETSGNWVEVQREDGGMADEIARVRPKTMLRVSYQYDDPDYWQEDTSTILWTGPGIDRNNSRVVTLGGSPGRLYDISVSVMPQNNYEEFGDKETVVGFGMTNSPPVVTALTVTGSSISREGKGFTSGGDLRVEYTVSDPNGDAINVNGTVKSQHPWFTNPISNEGSFSVYYDEGSASDGYTFLQNVFNPFFTFSPQKRNTYLSNAIFEISVTDDFGETASRSTTLYPVNGGDVTTQRVTPVASDGEVTLGYAGELTDLTQSKEYYDQLCQDRLGSEASGKQFFRMLTSTAWDTVIDSRMPPRYWNSQFDAAPGVLLANGTGISGKDTTTEQDIPTSQGGNWSLLCEQAVAKSPTEITQIRVDGTTTEVFATFRDPDSFDERVTVTMGYVDQTGYRQSFKRDYNPVSNGEVSLGKILDENDAWNHQISVVSLASTFRNQATGEQRKVTHDLTSNVPPIFSYKKATVDLGLAMADPTWETPKETIPVTLSNSDMRIGSFLVKTLSDQTIHYNFGSVRPMPNEIDNAYSANIPYNYGSLTFEYRVGDFTPVFTVPMESGNMGNSIPMQRIVFPLANSATFK